VKTSLAEQLGSEASEYRGALVASRFASAESEFAALRSGAVVMDRGWRVRYSVSGGDSQRWLNGMVTNTAALEPGHGNYSFLLNPQGRLQADASTFRDGDGYVLETDACQSETLAAWLDRYIIMDDVILEPVSTQSATLAIAGVNATQILAKAGVSSPETSLQLTPGSIGGVAVTVVRDDALCLPLFSLWHEPAQTRQLWDALLAAGATPAGWETAELLRIASGTPLLGVDLKDRDLPQETGQARALNFNKGCYIGQEIVERIRSRGAVHRGWSGFILDPAAEPPATGAQILQDGASVGELTSVARLPLTEGAKTVGLGIVRLQAVANQKPLTAGGVSLKPERLPFL
jgi:folate-binding protein YgfZ